MVLAPEQGLGIRWAGGGLEDGELGLSNRVASFVHPGQGIVALGCAGVHQDAGGRAGERGMGLGGVNDIGQGLNPGGQTGVGVGGILPDLIGEGGKVHLRVAVVIKDAIPFGVEIANAPIVRIVLEKTLVGAHDLGVLGQTLADALAQADEALDAIRGDKGIAEDAVGALADTVHAASALDEADDGPG